MIPVNNTGPLNLRDILQCAGIWQTGYALTLNGTRLIVVYSVLHIYKEDNFCDFLFSFQPTKPFLKRSLLKRKEIARLRSKVFPYRDDHLSQNEKKKKKKKNKKKKKKNIFVEVCTQVLVNRLED